ncbi:hypothetical protein EV182_002933 [Spiromyces aspiralis]|uniref:Uncharacterized protein n=1 Tax=Spiromyces aspiralis TaxID=68401 RepID=A0ACC1HGW7_9FUNG|nr:hypothetical protein EV182_002933 [Spiromyces aspiralis]
MVTREVAKPTVVSGCQLKPGIVAGVYIYGIHHNHRCYPDPETFDPDRFGPEDGNASDKDHGQRRTRMPFSWIPFIAGSRQCMGMNFSLIEQHVFLSMLLRKFEWTLPADSPFWKHTATGSFEISYPRDLNIVFTPRY